MALYGVQRHGVSVCPVLGTQKVRALKKKEWITRLVHLSIEECVHEGRNARSDGTAAKRFEGSSRLKKKKPLPHGSPYTHNRTETASERTRRKTISMDLVTRLAGISSYYGTRLVTMTSPPFPCAVAANKACTCGACAHRLSHRQAYLWLQHIRSPSPPVADISTHASRR